jgi:hypothetical protein
MIKQKDKELLQLLKVKELRYHIGRTENGSSFDLAVTEKGYQFYLDASPLDEEVNERLKEVYNL